MSALQSCSRSVWKELSDIAMGFHQIVHDSAIMLDCPDIRDIVSVRFMPDYGARVGNNNTWYERGRSLKSRKSTLRRKR